MMRVAAIQMNSGADVTANLEQAGRFIAQAARAGADGRVNVVGLVAADRIPYHSPNMHRLRLSQ